MNTEIINLTQHLATEEQIAEGVIDLPEQIRKELIRWLTIDELPNSSDLCQRAMEIGFIAKATRCKKAMIGGHNLLMPGVDFILRAHGILPLYAFSKRMVVENGGKKVVTFKHEGLVEVPDQPAPNTY